MAATFGSHNLNPEFGGTATELMGVSGMFTGVLRRLLRGYFAVAILALAVIGESLRLPKTEQTFHPRRQ